MGDWMKRIRGHSYLNILSSSEVTVAFLLLWKGLLELEMSSSKPLKTKSWLNIDVPIVSFILVCSYMLLFLFFMSRFNFSWVSMRLVNFWISFTFTNCYRCLNSFMWMNKSIITATPSKMEGIRTDSNELDSKTSPTSAKLTKTWFVTQRCGCSLAAFFIWY